MKTINFSILLAAFLIILTGCKKEDTIAPTVTFESPANGATFMVGDTIEAHIDVEDETEMHESIVTTTNKGTSVALDTEEYHSHDNDQHLDYEFIVDSTLSGTVLVIRCEAEDNAGNLGTAEIEVTVQ